MEIVDTKSEEFYSSTRYLKILKPLNMFWEPKEDITTYELALCM
jgi:hypothetical protein